MGYIDGAPCKAKQGIAQVTVLAYLPEGSGIHAMFARMTLDEWEVVSFNPLKREVCIRLLNDSKDTIISFLIPSPVML